MQTALCCWILAGGSSSLFLVCSLNHLKSTNICTAVGIWVCLASWLCSQLSQIASDCRKFHTFAAPRLFCGETKGWNKFPDAAFWDGGLRLVVRWFQILPDWRANPKGEQRPAHSMRCRLIPCSSCFTLVRIMSLCFLRSRCCTDALELPAWWTTINPLMHVYAPIFAFYTSFYSSSFFSNDRLVLVQPVL